MILLVPRNGPPRRTKTCTCVTRTMPAVPASYLLRHECLRHSSGRPCGSATSSDVYFPRFRVPKPEEQGSDNGRYFQSNHSSIASAEGLPGAAAREELSGLQPRRPGPCHGWFTECRRGTGPEEDRRSAQPFSLV